ncbi:MAG TPA: DUF6134 family protein [Alphaproteobacteria bacterium]|nr:DUF6134 family protein [Alphaproteobacteria bacterium]
MSRVLIALLALSSLAAVAPARADDVTPLVLEYQIRHPLYGDIGTYINTIVKSGDTTEVLTSVRVKVKAFGAVLYREVSDRTEHWRNGRLIGFESATEKDGKSYDVSGKADGDSFAITGPAGTFIAPADVQPPNPWSASCLNSSAMLSSMSGRIFSAKVIDQGPEMLSVGGQSFRTQKYEIDTDRPHTVWFNEAGIPLQIESDEEGQPVRLVLSHYPDQAQAVAALPRR